MASEPVGMTAILRRAWAEPRRIIEPSPKALVMVEMAASRSRARVAEIFSASAEAFSEGAAFSRVFSGLGGIRLGVKIVRLVRVSHREAPADSQSRCSDELRACGQRGSSAGCRACCFAG